MLNLTVTLFHAVSVRVDAVVCRDDAFHLELGGEQRVHDGHLIIDLVVRIGVEDHMTRLFSGGSISKKETLL